MASTENATYPIEMDRTLTSMDHEITDTDNRDVDLMVWVSRGDFEGVVIEGRPYDRDMSMVGLTLIGAIKLRDALNDAITIMGRWQ